MGKMVVGLRGDIGWRGRIKLRVEYSWIHLTIGLVYMGFILVRLPGDIITITVCTIGGVSTC